MTSFNFIFILAAFSMLIIIAFLTGKAVWPYHPKGQSGYLTDYAIFTLMPIVPLFVLVIAYNLAAKMFPILSDPTYYYVALAVSLLGLVGMRRLPLVKQAHARLSKARLARMEALQS